MRDENYLQIPGHTEQGFIFPCGLYCRRVCSSAHIPYCIQLCIWRSQNWRTDTSRCLSIILHSFVDSSGFMYALLLRGLLWNRCLKIPTIFFSDMNWRVGYRDGKTLDLYLGGAPFEARTQNTSPVWGLSRLARSVLGNSYDMVHQLPVHIWNYCSFVIRRYVTRTIHTSS